MTSRHLAKHSPLRIFAFSACATVAALVGVLVGKGSGAMIIAIILIAVEIGFSFDNAILNAKILGKLSPFWQVIFLTLGAAVAIFGMRIVFPLVIVALTADLGVGHVLDLALHHPTEYAEKLQHAHPALSSFGGAFLLVLAIDFLVDDTHQVTWLTRVEHSFRKLASSWAPPLMTLAVVGLLSAVPANHHKKETLIAGVLGVLVYSVTHGFTEFFGRVQKRRSKGMTYVGAAAVISLLYLEVLDATFSFDSVLGAFAITYDVVLIAVGLGVGALWVRSLTVFMVRRGTLGSYKYIEHGAHYTIGSLGCILFISLFVNVPEVITGLSGVGIIIASIIASRQALHDKHTGR